MKKFFKDTSNYLSFALAIIPSILLYIVQPTEDVPYALFAISILINLLLAWLSVKLYLDSKESSHAAIELFKCSNGKCLCRPNPYLSHRSIVSFYKNNDDFEELIGLGYVETITERGMVQIQLLNDDESQVFALISQHQNNIIVKPTVSVDKIQPT